MGLGAAWFIRLIAAPHLVDKAGVLFNLIAIDAASFSTKNAIGIASGLAKQNGGQVLLTDVRNAIHGFTRTSLRSFGYTPGVTKYIMIARDGVQLPIKAITAAKRSQTICKTPLPETVCADDASYEERRTAAREFIHGMAPGQPPVSATQAAAIINLARSQVCDIVCAAIRASVMGTDVAEITDHAEGEATAFYTALRAVQSGMAEHACIVASDTDIFGLMLANWVEITNLPVGATLWYYDTFARKFINAAFFCNAAAVCVDSARATLLAWFMMGTDYTPPCLGKTKAAEKDYTVARQIFRDFINGTRKPEEVETYLSGRLKYHAAFCRTATFIPHSGVNMLKRLLSIERVFKAKTAAEMPDFFAPGSGWGKNADGLCVPGEYAII